MEETNFKNLHSFKKHYEQLFKAGRFAKKDINIVFLTKIEKFYPNAGIDKNMYSVKREKHYAEDMWTGGLKERVECNITFHKPFIDRMTEVYPEALI